MARIVLVATVRHSQGAHVLPGNGFEKREGALLRMALCALLAAGWVSPASAQIVTAQSTAQNDLSCAADRAGTSGFNCTAGEFTGLVQFALPPDAPVECDAGGTFTAAVIAELNGTNADRYDGGIFIGQDANSPGLPGGSCSVATFPLTSSALPPRTRGFANIDGDACGDYRANGVENWQVNNVKVSCNANTVGQLTVPYLITYQQNNPGTCSGPSSSLLFPGSPSKCNSGNIPLPGVTVYGWVDLTKQTLPDGSAQAFSFTASGIGAQPLTFTLGDGQTQRVRIPLLGSTPTTLTITESATAGWSGTAAITCTAPDGTSSASTYVTTNNTNRTITANLTNLRYGAKCTITNTRLTRVRTVKALSPATDPGRFDLSVSGTSGTGAASATTAAVGDGGATAWLTVNAGSSAVFSEAAASGTNALAYASTYSCVNDSTGSVVASGSGTTVTIASVPASADTTCTFTNTRNTADLAIVKTASPTLLTVGGTVTYSLLVTNNGPQTVTGAVIKDMPGSALNCPGTNTVTCSGNATACATGPYLVSQLTGSGGITLGALPSATGGNSVTLSFSCTVQ